jgi:hypothetical protein
MVSGDPKNDMKLMEYMQYDREHFLHRGFILVQKVSDDLETMKKQTEQILAELDGYRIKPIGEIDGKEKVS